MSDSTESIATAGRSALRFILGGFVLGCVSLQAAPDPANFNPAPAKYYVATGGSDGNSGTNLDQPLATLARAVELAKPGDVISVRGGIYPCSLRVRLARSGTPSQPILVRAFPGERPVFDFSAQSFAATNKGIDISGSAWRVCGLEVTGAGSVGIHLTGHSNVVERCVVHHCRQSGIAISQPGSHNRVLNCDSYRNFDYASGTNNSHGEDADGFAAKFGIGEGNVFSGCRSWENADDGWDLWKATNAVFITNCWAFRNGTNFMSDPRFSGDGNGFKLGGYYYPGPHRVAFCVAFDNYHNGFDQNNNSAGLTLDNNTAWANGDSNFQLTHGTNTAPHVLRNNLSIAGGKPDAFRPGSLMTNNSWQAVSPPASTNDLLNTDPGLALAPRSEDGSLPQTPFLRPVPGGRLADKGLDLGNPFAGAAPDLGAFESPAK
jgi:hypothetical protein